MIRRFLRNEAGHTAIEYGMIAALCTIVIISSVASMGDSAAGMFQSLVDGWNTAGG